ncbi:efflux RND transporter periplasmic adaptor subunit [Bradyrhizobium sp. TZ2]
MKQGDILGYVTPPIAAIDVSDMRQRQGELDQQISIVERRFARYEQLAPSGAISRTQLDDTRLELEGLRERRASIDKSRRDPEALIAPVAGVIAEGSAVAGQIVQPSSIVFNIIDPSRLWVEALSFESIEPSRGARASTYTGRNYDLMYQGTGFADRSQSVPVHFAVTGDTAGLRAGQFLTVLVTTDDTKEGVAVPRSSVVRGSNGQDFVYEHIAPERFMARSVRTEPRRRSCADRVRLHSPASGSCRKARTFSITYAEEARSCLHSWLAPRSAIACLFLRWRASSFFWAPIPRGSCPSMCSRTSTVRPLPS